MKQPESLLELCNAAALKFCREGLNAATVEAKLCTILPNSLFEKICVQVAAKQRAQEVTTKVIRRHFVYFAHRERGRWGSYYIQTGRNDHKCQRCLDIWQTRRFKQPNYKLQELIEKHLFQVQMQKEFVKQGDKKKEKAYSLFLENIAQEAVHEWINNETVLKTSRAVKPQNDYSYYDPFVKDYRSKYGY